MEDNTIDAVGGPAVAAAAIARGPVEDHHALVEVDRAHYVFGEEIARGGMGRITAARDRRLGRDVAIKELLPHRRTSVRRFAQEARITARLEHVAIIRVYEAGVWPGGDVFYAMERIDGRSLDRVVADCATLAERLELLRGVLGAVDAMAYAHDRGIVHRDLKPSNLLVARDGSVKVIDWGLAKHLGDAPDAPGESTAVPTDCTAHGSIVGTPSYMPPEQARGEVVDERADVYSLGAMLYHVLTGAAPYTGASSDDVLAQALAGPPPPVRAREPGIPAALAAIVDGAMARDRADRPRTARALLEALSLAGRESPTVEVGRRCASPQWFWRRPSVSWVRRSASPARSRRSPSATTRSTCPAVKS